MQENSACHPELGTKAVNDDESGLDENDEEVDDSGELKLVNESVQVSSKDTGDVTIKWILLGISSHLAWGLHPVFARYLQVTRGLDGFLVLAISLSFSFLVLQVCTCSGLGGRVGARIGSVYSLLTLGRATTNMVSTKFTLALYTQLITQLGPFVVALLSCVFLKEAVPRCFLPALMLSTLGAMMTVVGMAEFDSMGIDSNDAIGIGLSLLSVIFSAGMRIFMKISSASLSEHELISWQYTNSIPFAIFALTTKTTSLWEQALTIQLHDILAVLAFALVTSLFANLSQVASVRHLGPTLASSLQPLRLVSTVFGAYMVLGECARAALTWSGLLLITCVLTMYLCAQRHKSSAQNNMVGKIKISTDCRATKYGRVARV